MTTRRSFVRLRVTSDRGEEIQGVGIRLAEGRGPIRTKVKYVNKSVVVSGLFFKAVGEGCRRGYEVIGPLDGGVWTVEVYCPGMESVRREVWLVDGSGLTDLSVVMRRVESGRWDDWDRSEPQIERYVAPAAR